MIAARPPELPCIRCGACAEACPAELQPQLLWLALRAGRTAMAGAQGLPDCNLCGACEPVCPGNIPLLSVLAEGRALLAGQQRLAAMAAAARQRHERRDQRLQRDSTERAEREEVLKNTASSVDAVAAAIERARARRARPRDPQ